MGFGRSIELEEPYMTMQPTATQFHDMHSGGRQKTAYGQIFVELPEAAAREWFAKTFGRNPDNVTCTCCGPDFSVKQADDLRQATAFERRCAFANVEDEAGGGHYVEQDRYTEEHRSGRVPLEEYIEKAASDPDEDSESNVLIVTADDLGEAWADEVER